MKIHVPSMLAIGIETCMCTCTYMYMYMFIVSHNEEMHN